MVQKVLAGLRHRDNDPTRMSFRGVFIVLRAASDLRLNRQIGHGAVLSIRECIHLRIRQASGGLATRST
jgi:hypothetical protein